ncbi:MAG TPA: response regulator [Anaerolineae bacterium]|nr:response regulator [Anaerolineae bacterium]
MTAKNILIVDDEPKVGYTLKESLESLGSEYVVAQAYSAEDALSVLARKPYDLVVTDLRMPGMNGLDLIGRVKRDAPQTQTILITAYGSNEIAEASDRLQAAHYFTKPFRIDEFVRVVVDTLKTPASKGASPAANKHFKWLVQRLNDLRFEVGAQYVILANMSGRLMAESGTIDGFDPALLASMLSRSLSPSTEIAQQLRGERVFNLVYHEGARYDVYAANVEEDLFMLLAFDRRQGVSRIGMVWLYIKRAIQELQTRIESQGNPPEVGGRLLPGANERGYFLR